MERRASTVRVGQNPGPWLWVAAALSLGLSLTPWGAVALYPFKLFTTWVHECGHALMTVLLGGRVMSIAIEPDTSGVTMSAIPTSAIAAGMVASAGYLTASVVGCVLIAATRVERWAHRILLFIGVLMGLTLIFWMRNGFGFLAVLLWGAALIMLARVNIGHLSRFVLGLLAIQVALNAVFDIRVLFMVHGGRSDAETMASIFLLPAEVWATMWMVTSVALLAWTLWVTRVKKKA